MKTSPTALSEIYNFRTVGDRLGTAGQPTECQFRSVRDAGFEAVINLALPTSDNALPNEGSVVTGLGMSYVHIPVDFKAPTANDFRVFCRVMQAFDGCRVFVHCAANMRVSAFVFLYRVLHWQVAPADAERDLHAVWQPDDVWCRFIHNHLKTNDDAAKRRSELGQLSSTPMEDRNTPESVVQRQLDAYNAHDVEALMATYAEDIELFEHPAKLLASGALQARERQTARLAEPNLQAKLIKRMVMGNIVIDQEVVTRTFPEGPGKVELIATYQVNEGRIAKAWFIFGAKTLDATP